MVFRKRRPCQLTPASFFTNARIAKQFLDQRSPIAVSSAPTAVSNVHQSRKRAEGNSCKKSALIYHLKVDLKIKNTTAIVECLSIYIITLVLVSFFNKINFPHGFSGVLIPAIFLYIPVLIIIISRRNPDEYGFTLSGWVLDFLHVLIFMLIFFPPVFGVYFIYRKLFFTGVLHISMPDDIVWIIITQILVVGLSEEAFFRGYLQKRLSDGIEGTCFGFFKIKISWPLVIANVFFTLTHIIVLGQLWRINVFLPGLAFGWLREQRRSLITPVLFHGLSNVFMKILEASF